MSVSDELRRSTAAVSLPILRQRFEWRALTLPMAFVFGTVLLRLPTFFEPAWHADEGIFAAVAQRVVSGGQLYADAWEAKPPLFLYIYTGLTEAFGAGVLPLRIATAASAIGTELALFAIALRFTSQRRALVAAALLAVLLAVPFWEGNLALADSFAILPATLAVLCCLRSEGSLPLRNRIGFSLPWALLAGALFGAAFLIRPTSAVVAVALVLWLLLSGRPWLLRAAVMAFGSAAVVLPTAGLFALFGSFHWFWDANVGFFFEYVPSGQELPFHHRPLIVTPAIIAIGALAWSRFRGQLPRWGLAALWLTFTLAMALLTGRPYSHYFLQVFPPLALVLAFLVPGGLAAEMEQGTRNREQVPFGGSRSRFQVPGSRLPLAALAIASAVVLLWLTIVVPAFNGNLFAMRYTKEPDYYLNFASWTVGLKSTEDYNTYFDRRVNLTERLDATLTGLGARGDEVYIWGEVPWVYALAETEPALRYMTSFYVLLIPYLDTTLGISLTEADPRFIVVLNDAWPRIEDSSGILQQRYLNATRSVLSVIASRYEQVAIVGRARIFERTQERPTVLPRPALDN